MPTNGSGLGGMLTAAEDAAPMASVDVVAHNLSKRFKARSVSFLLVDLVGQKLVRLTEAVRNQRGHSAEQITLAGSDYDTVLRTQQLYRAPLNDGGQRVMVPVTNRGDAIGVLELILPQTDEEMLEQVREAAHALAYIIVTDRRFTDLYKWEQRTTGMSLAAEIQHQLLPSASCCEAAEFTVAAALVPADHIGGDTYDFALGRGTVHLSITDAMGHDVEAALLATVLVNALRRARRAGADAAEQARQAHRAMLAHGRTGFATGQLLRISLDGSRAQLVNAGHPWPLVLRDGVVQEMPLRIDLPFGLLSPTTHRVQDLDLRSGDRVILYTDGMQERAARTVDLPALIHHTADLHPRETVRALTDAVVQACAGKLPDDATVLCLDWYGPHPTGRHTNSGADPATASTS